MQLARPQRCGAACRQLAWHHWTPWQQKRSRRHRCPNSRPGHNRRWWAPCCRCWAALAQGCRSVWEAAFIPAQQHVTLPASVRLHCTHTSTPHDMHAHSSATDSSGAAGCSRHLSAGVKCRMLSRRRRQRSAAPATSAQPWRRRPPACQAHGHPQHGRQDTGELPCLALEKSGPVAWSTLKGALLASSLAPVEPSEGMTGAWCFKHEGCTLIPAVLSAAAFRGQAWPCRNRSPDADLVC